MLDKQNQKLRKALSKETATRLRQRVKGTGWKTSQGWLFREDAGWFIDARCNVWVGERKTTVAIHMKPMGIDPVFWSIVRAQDNIHMPLSFRLFGGWTCSTPAWSETEIDENDLDADGIAESIISWSTQELTRTRARRRLEDFVDFIKGHHRGLASPRHLATLICAYVLREDRESALAECLAASKANDIGGFLVGSKSFVDLATEWLEMNKPARH